MLLQCNEKFIFHPSSTEMSSKESKSRLSKKERKALEKSSQLQLSMKENAFYQNQNSSRLDFSDFDKENESHLESSLSGDFVKHNIFESNRNSKMHKNSVNMDSLDERIYLNTTPPAKFMPSPYKPRDSLASPVPSRDHKLEGTLFSPSNDKYRSLWMTNLEAVEWRSQKYNKNINTPLSKEVEMQMDKRTP
mmetsp:Transcript_29750/g.26322  ORF Transcript_29750/g.26322 Transcript_29750/m.26322 type:complete len:192 (+) Transcript_29750:472-1047(+)